MAKFLQLVRPQFLIASLALFIIGVAWAILLGAQASLLRILLGYLIILPAHLSVSFSNDYFDVEVDKRGTPTLFSGGSGILVENPQLRKPALWIAITLNLCSVGLGILFLILYSVPIWFLGYIAVSNLLAWVYSAPPFRLAYRGLGELVTAFAAGFLIPGMGVLVTQGYLNWDRLFFTLPLMLYGLAFILAVEIPDVEADRRGLKKTWVARKGWGFAFTAIGTLLMVATGFFFCISALSSHPLPVDFRLLGFLSLLPLGMGVIGMVKRPADRHTAIQYANGTIGTLAMFFILTDVVLVYAASN